MGETVRQWQCTHLNVRELAVGKAQSLSDDGSFASEAAVAGAQSAEAERVGRGSARSGVRGGGERVAGVAGECTGWISYRCCAEPELLWRRQSAQLGGDSAVSALLS